MPKNLLIVGGTVVNADRSFSQDVRIADGVIAEIGPNLSPNGEEVIDAGGKILFPGAIDPHVHAYLPFMGTVSCDGFDGTSRGALCGGTTTIIEMLLNEEAGQSPAERIAAWRGKAELSLADFTYHFAITDWKGNAEAELERIVREEGITSFKVFLAYKGALDVSDEILFKALRVAARLGVTVTAHCENAEVIDALQQELLAEGKKGPECHYLSRPPEVEAAGVAHFCHMLELTGASGYIVHLSCKEALAEAVAARLRGVNVKVETLIQYLLADRTWAERPDFEGARSVMSPPLRDSSNHEVLWNGLRTGLIDTVATDHAPFTLEQKEMGRGDFTKIPNGMGTVQWRVPLLYSYGVKSGRITWNDLVRLCCASPAQIFGLYPRKGVIAVGADADMCVFDEAGTSTISLKTQETVMDYCNFDGWKLFGSFSLVTLRGEVMVRDEAFIGPTRHGQFLARSTT